VEFVRNPGLPLFEGLGKKPQVRILIRPKLAKVLVYGKKNVARKAAQRRKASSQTK
jgi:hypothetical protein